MKENKGITLISLVVIVVIMILLTSVGINYGLKTYKIVALQNFETEITIIQERLDIYLEENASLSNFTKLTDLPNDNDDYLFFFELINNPEKYNITQENWINGKDDNIENYYYFTSSKLEENLGLKQQKLTVIINFETKNIISKNGVNYNNKTFYRKCDIDYN